MSHNVLYLIRTGMDGFSKGQKRIANYILSNYDKAAFMTACRLGQIAQVSESTVVRFASQLGYDGYPAMQKALQELIRGKLTSIQRIEASGEQINSGDIAGSVMQRDMETIRSTIERMDRTEFDLAVEKLVEAKHIYLLGVRSSAFLAGYLNFYFHLIFENVTLVQSAAGEIFDQMLRMGPGDVLVGISFPRYSQMAVNAVRFARDRGGGCDRRDGQQNVAYLQAGQRIPAGEQRYDLLCGLYGGPCEPAECADHGGGTAEKRGDCRVVLGTGACVVPVWGLWVCGR